MDKEARAFTGMFSFKLTMTREKKKLEIKLIASMHIVPRTSLVSYGDGKINIYVPCKLAFCLLAIRYLAPFI